MQLQSLPDKLANDIATVLYRLRLGYQDHISFCHEQLRQNNPPESDIISLNNSIQQHLYYIRQLESFVHSIGFAFPNELET